jgi:hypothetical protein
MMPEQLIEPGTLTVPGDRIGLSVRSPAKELS